MALSDSIAVWADSKSTAAQKLEATAGLIPVLGNVVGLGEGISHRDPEAVAVNTIALASVVIAQAIPVVGEVIDMALLAYAAVRGFVSYFHQLSDQAKAIIHDCFVRPLVPSSAAPAASPRTAASTADGTTPGPSLGQAAMALDPAVTLLRSAYCLAIGTSPTLRGTLDRWERDPPGVHQRRQVVLHRCVDPHPDCHTGCRGAAGWYEPAGPLVPTEVPPRRRRQRHHLMRHAGLLESASARGRRAGDVSPVATTGPGPIG